MSRIWGFLAPAKSILQKLCPVVTLGFCPPPPHPPWKIPVNPGKHYSMHPNLWLWSDNPGQMSTNSNTCRPSSPERGKSWPGWFPVFCGPPYSAIFSWGHAWAPWRPWKCSVLLRKYSGPIKNIAGKTEEAPGYPWAISVSSAIILIRPPYFRSSTP